MYAYLVGAILVMVAIAGAGWKGYSLGGDSVRAVYAERDLKAAAENAAKFQALSNEYREKEQALAGASAAVSKKYQKELANHETTKLAALAAVDAGTLRLRLTDSAECKADRSSAAKTAATAGGRDGAAEGRFLGKADSAFLIAEASRANEIVGQLTACQDLLESERK